MWRCVTVRCDRPWESWPCPPTPPPGSPIRSGAPSANGDRVRLAILLGATAVLYLWNVTINGMGNQFYVAAVQTGSSDWEALLFGSLDANNLITVDKSPLSQWVMGLSGQLFGFSSASHRSVVLGGWARIGNGHFGDGDRRLLRHRSDADSAAVQDDVARHQVAYYRAPRGSSHGAVAEDEEGEDGAEGEDVSPRAHSDILRWVRGHCHSTTVGGGTADNLFAPKSAPAT